MLDRLETAVTGHGPDYGVIENLADVELANQFVHTWWGVLDHAEQRRYLNRLKYLKFKGRDARA